jgi:DNA-binding GntR family transcriptional regulator
LRFGIIPHVAAHIRRFPDPDMATKRSPGRRKRPAADSSLTDQAYAKLEELIVTLALAPGEVVSESALGAQLGIGRTPIREALHRLARERLVNILPRRGIVVSEINVGAQLRLLEVRREIERLVARSAARRASDEERAEFMTLAKAFEAAAKEDAATAFMRTDRAFNELALVAARNEYASGAMLLMHSLSRRFWFIHYRQAADMPLAAKLHAAVARAIARGDAKAAASASDALVDYIEAFTRSTADPSRP